MCENLPACPEAYGTQHGGILQVTAAYPPVTCVAPGYKSSLFSSPAIMPCLVFQARTHKCVRLYVVVKSVHLQTQ